MAKKKTALSKEKKQDLVFAGATHLMGADPSKMRPAEIAAHKARMLVAKALGIPATTVVVMGNVPYVDNHGRKYKLAEYAPMAQFEYDYVQIAKDDNEKAIVKCRIIEPAAAESQARPLCGWVIGECSPKTTRMTTLVGYQNHLAQTRAENRAFEAAFGTRFRKDLYEGVAKIVGCEGGNIENAAAVDPEVNLALQAANTSAEEAVQLKQQATPLNFDPFKNAKNAVQQAKTIPDLVALRTRIKGSTHLKPVEINKLYDEIDERIAKISAGA